MNIKCFGVLEVDKMFIDWGIGEDFKEEVGLSLVLKDEIM